MSTSYIIPTHSNIGDYKISDALFDSSNLDSTIESFKSISSTFNEKITQNTDDIEYLSSVLSTLNLKALRHAIADVGILKPEDAYQLYLNVNVFDSFEMSDSLGTIDMSSSSDWKYFKVLLVNNGENSASASTDPLLSTYFPGTQWIDPAAMDEAIKTYNISGGFEGYGTAFNNSPVNISFLQWLDDTGLSAGLDANSRFYLRYEWYYIDEDGETHKSDHYSMVVPSFAEVGAKAGAQVSKSEIYELKQALETDVTVAKYITEDEIEVLDGETNTGLDDYPAVGYYANPYQCTILSAFGSCDKEINLQSYSEGKTYKLKFTTGSSDVTVGSSPSSTVMTFYGNYGNGPEKIDELNSTSVTFSSGKTYLIAVNLGMIQVLAVK